MKDRFEFPCQLDMYPYTVEGADEAEGRVGVRCMLCAPPAVSAAHTLCPPSTVPAHQATILWPASWPARPLVRLPWHSCAATVLPLLPLLQVPVGKKAPGHYQYELRGVVVHSGSAFAGHYYSYIQVGAGAAPGWQSLAGILSGKAPCAPERQSDSVPEALAGKAERWAQSRRLRAAAHPAALCPPPPPAAGAPAQRRRRQLVLF